MDDDATTMFTIDLCGDRFHRYTSHCRYFRGQNDPSFESSMFEDCDCPHCMEVSAFKFTLDGMAYGAEAMDY